MSACTPCRETERSARAEAFVVDVLGDGRVLAADRAGLVLAQLERAEGHLERVVHQEATNQRVALAEDQLEHLGGLHDADDARQDAQYASLGAGRREVRRRRLRVEAAVAGALLRI